MIKFTLLLIFFKRIDYISVTLSNNKVKTNNMWSYNLHHKRFIWTTKIFIDVLSGEKVLLQEAIILVFSVIS